MSVLIAQLVKALSNVSFMESWGFESWSVFMSFYKKFQFIIFLQIKKHRFPRAHIKRPRDSNAAFREVG